MEVNDMKMMDCVEVMVEKEKYAIEGGDVSFAFEIVME